MNRLKNFKMFEAYNVINGKLDVSKLDLTSLDELPEGIYVLYCFMNKLSELPKLPNSLEILQCYKNKLTSLPELPSILKDLYCFDNKLIELPKLPEGLKVLHCAVNDIKILPELPESLENLYCYVNPLECLIPEKFVSAQNTTWLANYYYPYIRSYKGQKNILTKQPHMLKELEKQSEMILPEIKIEFEHLFTGTNLNLM